MQESSNNRPDIDDVLDIDVTELLSRLWKSRTMIVRWCLIGAVVGLIVGFSIPKTYKARVILVPEVQQRTSSGVSSIASMMGVNLNNSVDAINAEMFPDVVHSTAFIYELFDLPVTFERKGSMITVPLLEYMKDYQKSPWWNSVLHFPFKVLGWVIDILTPDPEYNTNDTGALDVNNLPRKERAVVGYFAENILVNVDKKTLKVQMSLEMQDPLVVATVMEAVTENLKNYMSDYRTSKSRQDVQNLQVICDQRKSDYYKAQKEYASYLDANKNVVLESVNAERAKLQQEMNLAYQVYTQVATNLEGARIQAEQAKPVFVILENVSVPINRAAPSKAKILLICVFLAGCCAAAWALYRDIVMDFKKRLNN